MARGVARALRRAARRTRGCRSGHRRDAHRPEEHGPAARCALRPHDAAGRLGTRPAAGALHRAVPCRGHSRGRARRHGRARRRARRGRRGPHRRPGHRGRRPRQIATTCSCPVVDAVAPRPVPWATMRSAPFSALLRRAVPRPCPRGRPRALLSHRVRVSTRSERRVAPSALAGTKPLIGCPERDVEQRPRLRPPTR